VISEETSSLLKERANVSREEKERKASPTPEEEVTERKKSYIRLVARVRRRIVRRKKNVLDRPGGMGYRKGVPTNREVGARPQRARKGGGGRLS